MKTSDIAKQAVRAGGQRHSNFFPKDQLTIDVKGPQDYVSGNHTVEAIMIDFLQPFQTWISW